MFRCYIVIMEKIERLEQNLNEKIKLNREIIKNELLGLINNTDFNFTIDIDELIRKILDIKESGSINNIFSYRGMDFSLHIINNGKSDHRFDLFNKEEVFNTSHSDNKHIAGWVSQGGFSSYDLDGNTIYNTQDHSGIAVDSSLQGFRFADILYNLKALVDDQLEYENCSGDNLNFLAFYIRKGYIPYSKICIENKTGIYIEKIINEEDFKKIIYEIKNSQKDNSRNTDYSFKLKLDPVKAKKVTEEILSKQKQA